MFAEYVGASWCGPSIGSASPSLNELKSEHPEEMVSFLTTVTTETTHRTLESPKPRYGWRFRNSCIKFGDAKAPSTYHRTGGGTSGTMYDSIFSSGGNMVTPGDFDLIVSQSQNGNNMEIEITATYIGSSPSVTAYLQGVVTEHYGAQPYDNGNIPHNVIRIGC